VDFDASFQDRGHDSISRGLHKLLREGSEDCAVAVFVYLVGCVDCLPHCRKVEVVDEVKCVWGVGAVVVYVVWAEAGAIVCEKVQSCSPCSTASVAVLNGFVCKDWRIRVWYATRVILPLPNAVIVALRVAWDRDDASWWVC